MSGYTPAKAPDITGTPVGSLSARTNTSVFGNDKQRFDLAIGGVPFFVSSNPNHPMIRQTAPLQKPQFDISPEPGEQALNNYWVRSQTSWHRGAGISYYEPAHARGASQFWEPGADLITQYRYEASAGMDVWTRDQATLLHSMAQVTASTAGQPAWVTTGKMTDGTDCFYELAAGSVVKRKTASASQTYTNSAMTPATKIAVAGAKILVGGITGIDQADAYGTSTPTFANLWTIASGAVVVPYWVKGRIVASRNNYLYQLTLTGGAIASPTNDLHVHADTGWIWTSVCEGPSAIYAAGYSNSRSAIYRFDLKDAGSGTLPQLGQAYEVASMPTGEQILCIDSYLGSYLGIGTNKGLRVALIDQYGDLTYGPLSVETDNGVADLEGNGSFIYGTINGDIETGKAASVRVNLGQPLPHEDLRYAWAYDAQTHATGVPSSIAFLGSSDRVVLGVTAVGTYLQSATLYETSGYITSGRIRFRTTEKKDFVSADISAKLTDGSIAFSVFDENGTEFSLSSITSAYNEGRDIAISRPDGYHEYLSFKLTVYSSSSHLITPTLESLFIRALPAARTQRLIQYPLMCSDNERDSASSPVGYEGYAWERLTALEEIEEGRVRILVQDFVTGESYEGLIEELSFTRTEVRAADGRPNFGGILKVTMRKL